MEVLDMKTLVNYTFYLTLVRKIMVKWKQEGNFGTLNVGISIFDYTMKIYFIGFTFYRFTAQLMNKGQM
jgi:hypothetical protein